MNVYKKTLAIIGLSLSVTQAYGLTAGEIKTFMANEVTQPFQSLIATNLFNKQVPTTFFNNLATTATLVKQFIQDTGKNDTDLMKAFGHAQNATNVLINGIRECYTKLQAKDYTSANSILRDFVTLNNNMNTVKNAIDKTTFYIAGKKEARDILATFTELLMFIAKQSQLAIVSKLPKPENV